MDDNWRIKSDTDHSNTYMPNWLIESRQEKRVRDARQDRERCYREFLRDKITVKIAWTLKALAKKTRYKLEMRHSVASLEIFVSHLERKSGKPRDSHFKLTPCHNGIFLMYGGLVKDPSHALSAQPVVLYSRPEPISHNISRRKIIKWIGKAANIKTSSLQLTEYAAELEMKNDTAFSEAEPPWRISFCCFMRRLLRDLGLV